jgi:4-hydroxybenzoate polyprenyltransferase
LYARLTRLNRPIGALLLLWPTLWSLWLANRGHPPARLFFIFIAGVWLTRGAGCAINDFADRHFDGAVPRTRNRPLAQKSLHPWEAWLVAFLLGIPAVFLLTLLPPLDRWLALIGVALTVSYPFLKRWTSLPQPYLGLAFGWGIPMAWVANGRRLDAAVALLFVANILWATVYDTFYAMADRPWDRKVGIRSTAILFGEYDRLIVFVLQVLLLVGLYLLGRNLHLGWVYDTGLAAAGGFALYEQKLAWSRSPEGCFRAFLNNNWFGAAIFAGIILNYSLIR